MLDASKYYLSNCVDTGFINAYDAPFSYYCENDGVIRRIYSEHSNQKDDRIWGFICCRITNVPTPAPTLTPTNDPTSIPTTSPTNNPSLQPMQTPTKSPSSDPSVQPSIQPTSTPSMNPSLQPMQTPTKAPSSDPSVQPSIQPTSNPSKNPSTYPTIPPSTNPSLNPSSDPSIHPSVNPSNKPTSNPSTFPSTGKPTHYPSVSPQVVRKPSVSPTKDPAQQPTGPPSKYPTKLPTDAPTDKPTRGPTDDPTEYPTRVPSNSPTQNPATVPSLQTTTSTEFPTNNPITFIRTSNAPSGSPITAGRRTLYFLCIYEDDKDFVTTYLSLSHYAHIMVDAIVYAMRTLTVQSIYYHEVGTAGIVNFVICGVFNTELSNRDCASYSNHASSRKEDDNRYIAIGSIVIAADHAINMYQEWLIDVMTSDALKDAFTRHMNRKLTNSTANARRLLEYNRFKAVNINVMNPSNDTMTTTDNELEFGDSHNDTTSNRVTMIIIIIVCVSIVIVLLISLVWMRMNRPNNKAEPKGFEMNQLVVEQRSVAENVTQNIVNGESQYEDDADSDEEIIEAVNETLMEDNGNDDEGVIVNSVNETYDQVTHVDDIVEDINDTHDATKFN
eukprot:469251_1